MGWQKDFSEYSIALYSRGKVAGSCLALQDRYGLDVNAVLFCCWFGARRGLIDEELWARIDEISRQWQQRLVRPLRDARRWLKNPGFALDRETRDLRERIKDQEVAAELAQQRAMATASANLAADAPERPVNPATPAQAAAAARSNLEALLRRRDTELDPDIENLFAEIIRTAFPSTGAQPISRK